jgi:hypothetical protein
MAIVNAANSNCERLCRSGNDVDSQSSMVQPNTRGTAPGFVILSAPKSQVFETDRFAWAGHAKEQLGQREIGRIIAEGTRFVRTISLGAFRNEKPIEITTEEW